MPSATSPSPKSLLMRIVRAIALFAGVLGLMTCAILFWGVFAAEGSFHLSTNGFAFLGGICICSAVSMFLCLWGAEKQNIVNYLRLLGFPLAVLTAMQFEDGPAFGLFYFALSFVTIIMFWNIALSVLQRFMKSRA